MSRPPRILFVPEHKEINYFITICTKDRKKALDNPHVFESVSNANQKLKQWVIHAFIIMPDHIHALISPLNRDESVGTFSTLWKRFIRNEIVGRAALLGTWEWQEGCFDRLLRTNESLNAKWL